MATPGFHIPVVDIAPFLAGGSAARLGVARAFGAALEQVGFVTITGHGIDRRMIELDVSRRAPVLRSSL